MQRMLLRGGRLIIITGMEFNGWNGVTGMVSNT
jgi:hypothetical protein